MSLSDKVKSNQFIVVDAITLEKAKTKEFVAVLGGLKKSVKDMGKKHMLLLPTAEASLVRASRNVPGVSPTLANSLNIVDVMKADSIVVLKDALAVIEKVYLKESKKK
jgi:large subunit ribosomal protein L4